MSILVINAGSSSLKFGLFQGPTCDRLVAGQIDWANGDRQQACLLVRTCDGTTLRLEVAVPDSASAASCALQAVLALIQPGRNGVPAITAVGHRVVHGGVEFRASVMLDDQVKAGIARWSELAPLHNPPTLKAIEAAEGALPGKPQVAVFDTAFYAQLPPKAYLYALPYEWYEKWGIRRFGFHGISHAYCAGRAAELTGRDPGQLRVVSCHLGGGCSTTAIRGGVAVAMTSGFSPLDGLMMGTRCGSIDPGILLHIQEQRGLAPGELARALNYSAGLSGVSGVSADLAQIEAAAAQGNERARLAFDMFAGQVRGAVAALAATLGGIDVLTFTDRIGEGSPALRRAICEGLEFMGIELDPQRNAVARADTDVAAVDSSVRVMVIHTEEELMVARETCRVLGVKSST